MNKYKILILGLLSLGVVFSCKKEEEEKEYMSGSTEFTIPSYVKPGQVIQAYMGEAYGPDTDKIEYFWTATNTKIIADTVVGRSLKTTIPDTTGSFSITASAKADGYYSKITSKSLEIVKFVSDTTASLQGVEHSTNFMTDARDNKKYYYSKAGNLYWFEQNIDYKGEGDKTIGTGYDGADVMGNILGRLYSWEEATGGVTASGLGNGPQGICPEGWSVPTKEDWEDLAKALSGGEEKNFDDKWEGLGSEVMVDATFNGLNVWPYSPNNEKNNKFHWNALSTGHSENSHKDFSNIFVMGMWWCSTEYSPEQAYYRFVYFNQSYFDRHAVDKSEFGVSVRCVKLAD